MAVFTDNFDRANNTDLGANWTPISGESALNINTNAVIPPLVSSDCGEYYSGGSFANDQYAQAVLPTIATSAGGTGMGVIVRASAAAQTYYAVTGSAGGTEIQKFLAGSFSSLKTDSTVWANGDTIRLEVSGASPAHLVVKRNGTTIAGMTTDDASSPIASGSAGARHSSISTVAPTLDDWEGGDLSAGAAVPAPKRLTLLGVGN